jgi:hypothetical protein
MQKKKKNNVIKQPQHIKNITCWWTKIKLGTKIRVEIFEFEIDIKGKVEFEIKPTSTTIGKWSGDWSYKHDLQWEFQTICVLLMDSTSFNAQSYTSLAKKNKKHYNIHKILV